jgi:hypothetical protein
MREIRLEVIYSRGDGGECLNCHTNVGDYMIGIKCKNHRLKQDYYRSYHLRNRFYLSEKNVRLSLLRGDYSYTASIKKGEYDEVEISEGDVLKITPEGTIEKSRFNFCNYLGRGWWEYDLSDKTVTESYIEDLKYLALAQGIAPEEVDELLKEGFSLDDIEEYLYGM